MCLESHQIIHGVPYIILTELYDCIRLLARCRIRKSNRFHRSETHRIFPAGRHNFYRHTPFENISLFKSVHVGYLCRSESFIKGFILSLIHRTIQISRLSLIIAGHTVNDIHVERFFCDNRCSGIIKMKTLSSAKFFYCFCKFSVCKRTCCYNDYSLFGNIFCFFRHKFNQRMTFYLFRYCPGKTLTIHCQRPSGRYTVAVGTAHNDRAQPAHFFF